MLMKNGRKLSVAVGLQGNRREKLEYWRKNKGRIVAD